MATFELLLRSNSAVFLAGIPFFVRCTGTTPAENITSVRYSNQSPNGDYSQGDFAGVGDVSEARRKGMYGRRAGKTNLYDCCMLCLAA